ncbi:MAG: hypothetical protein QUS35_11490, partial [bacterium]|nr:hypothetical protein [bacterium]
MDMLELLRKQTTTRKDEFTAGAVPDELVETIQSSILQTANASNRQSYSVIVLDREKAGRLGLPGDRAFVFCVDFHRLYACARALEREFDSGTPMQFVTALIDVSLLAQSAVLAAQSLGLATRITNEVYQRNPDELFAELGLPEHRVFPMLAVSLGVRADPRKKQKGRLSRKFLFHEGRYRIPDDRDILEIIGWYDSCLLYTSDAADEFR